MDPRRIGKFKIASPMVVEMPHVVRQVLRDLIPVRAEMLHYADAIEYVAYGEAFDVVRMGAEVPWYDVQITDLIGGKHDIKFIKRVE